MATSKKQNLRVNLADLKVRFRRRIGARRAEAYFELLVKLLSQKLSKIEFDRLCYGVIGRDNIALHNQFIRAILQNACLSSLDFPGPKDGKMLEQIHPESSNSNESFVANNERIQIGICSANSNESSVVNNERAQSGLLGQNQNGESNSLSTVDSVGFDCSSFHNANNNNHKREECCTSHRSDLGAFQPEIFRSYRRLRNVALFNGEGLRMNKDKSCAESNELPATDALKGRMQKIAETMDVQNVSEDCATVLNNGLNAYLKGLIVSCISLKSDKNVVVSSEKMSHCCQQIRRKADPLWVSFHDFKTAMEMRPQQFGVDWPYWMEKLCLHPRSFRLE